MDLSIIIVHYNIPKLLRQTLKGIFLSAPAVPFEVIVVDNNPAMRISESMRKEFPQCRFVVSEYNRGYGGGVNEGMRVALGKYLAVLNPDIVLFPKVLEELCAYMESHADVGIVSPQLKNPDGSIQYSCMRFMTPSVVLCRRLPFASKTGWGRKQVAQYLMHDADHTQTQEVDYLLGSALLVRREAVNQVGGFDPKFFMYFEDQDLCRRFWKAGWKVVYHPAVSMVHYHRRETAEGNLLRQVFNPLTHRQLASALYYFRKYRGEGNPRTGNVQDPNTKSQTNSNVKI